MSKRAYWTSLLADIAEIVTTYDIDGSLPDFTDSGGIQELREVLRANAPTVELS